MTYARLHPAQFPDGAVGTLTKELGYLLDIPIYYYAAINLDGFKQMVDLVGGVIITYGQDILDPSYGWDDGSPNGFFLHAGAPHLDGRNALAFVRSQRPTATLLGLRDSSAADRASQEADLAVDAAKLPALLKAAAQTVRTDFPQDKVADMVALVRRTDDSSIQRYVLGPPYSTHPPNTATGGIYTLKLNMARVAKLSAKLFGADSRYYVAPSPAASPSAAP